MENEIKLPEMGEQIESGKVVTVLVKAGDAIEVDQPIAEVETDKALIEIPAPVKGTVTAVHFKEGEDVSVGQLLLTVETGDAAAKETPASGEDAEAQSPPEEKAPPSGEDAEAEEEKAPPASGEDAEETASGKDAEAGEEKAPPAEKEKAPSSGEDAEAEEEKTPPAEKEKAPPAEKEKAPPAEKEKAPPAAKETPAPEEDAEETPASGEDAEAEEEKAPPAGEEKAPPAADLVPASPSVKRLAREMGVDITQVTGTALEGRISADDVKDHAKRMLEGGASAPRLPDFTKWGKIERAEMDGIRRATSRRLSHAWTTIPHVTQCEKADITEIEKFRKKFAPQAEAAGGKLTVTVIFLKLMAAALKVFPKFAASIDPAANKIIYKKYAHIGVAVDTEHGLLVPVIRDVDRKSLVELSVELGEAAERARTRRLTLEDMEGGCITITNLGGIGGTYFTPIVNWPEAAILGISRARTEPVFIDGEFRPRLMLPIQVSYDHRLIDGADGIRFLRWIADALENPILVLMEG